AFVKNWLTGLKLCKRLCEPVSPKWPPMLSVGTKKRIARIRRRAIAEVLEAYQQGRISARRADILLYLPQDEQRAELGRILSLQEDTKHRNKIAVEVIRRHLA